MARPMDMGRHPMCDWCGNDFTDDEPEYEEGMHEHCYDEWLEETEDDDDGR